MLEEKIEYGKKHSSQGKKMSDCLTVARSGLPSPGVLILPEAVEELPN